MANIRCEKCGSVLVKGKLLDSARVECGRCGKVHNELIKEVKTLEQVREKAKQTRDYWRNWQMANGITSTIPA